MLLFRVATLSCAMVSFGIFFFFFPINNHCCDVAFSPGRWRGNLWVIVVRSRGVKFEFRSFFSVLCTQACGVTAFAFFVWVLECAGVLLRYRTHSGWFDVVSVACTTQSWFLFRCAEELPILFTQMFTTIPYCSTEIKTSPPGFFFQIKLTLHPLSIDFTNPLDWSYFTQNKIDVIFPKIEGLDFGVHVLHGCYQEFWMHQMLYKCCTNGHTCIAQCIGNNQHALRACCLNKKKGSIIWKLNSYYFSWNKSWECIFPLFFKTKLLLLNHY